MPLLEQIPHMRHIEVNDQADRRIVQVESPDVNEALVARVTDLEFVIGVRWRR